MYWAIDYVQNRLIHLPIILDLSGLIGYNWYMTKIYRSLINGAPFIVAMALGLSFMDAQINYWKVAFISLALLNSIKYLIDHEYADE